MKTNRAVKEAPIFTHEGGKAVKTNAEALLRRSVMSCLLWEKEFYEDGVEISKRIADLVKVVKPEVVAQIAVDCRHLMKLRHIPLFLTREMCRHPEHRKHVRSTLVQVIQRADELTEFLAMYWKDGKEFLCHQARKGLRDSFAKFEEYHFAKYDQDNAVKLRDVMFQVHPNPTGTKGRKALYKRIAQRELKTPDTWEVNLSDGQDKKTTWLRLLKAEKLGGLALLRNLKNMREAGIEQKKIEKAISELNVGRLLPINFITAAKHNPSLEQYLESKFMECFSPESRMKGSTVILVDVSGSMDGKLSMRSELTRLDVACSLAIIGREMFQDLRIVTFSDRFTEVPARHGFGLRDAIITSQSHGSTYLGQAVKGVMEMIKPKRLIVITDEQSHDTVPQIEGYMINVASARNGVGYRKWVHIDGWSDKVLNYIQSYEAENE